MIPLAPQQLITMILGPTASGKSALAIEWAKQNGGCILSADAFQVYQGLDIGTAKVPWPIRQDIPHYLMDIKSPKEAYDVTEFVKTSQAIIGHHVKQHKPLIICGGTAMYLYALLNNFQFAPHCPSLRQELEQTLATQGLNALVQQLETRFPHLISELDCQNPRRVVRALEKALLEKEQVSLKIYHPPYPIHCIGLLVDRPLLRHRIEKRVDQMIQKGLISEVAELIQRFPCNAQAFQAIGYKECIQHLQGSISFEQMLELIKVRTRQFAKRQMTWFRKFKDVKWIESSFL